ncbi:TetR family transcriptional regulator [Amycolatopsis sp. PS_44_ISF1]|uniref:TetR/AcrR family transcriptional regulator n=1 Tax=Amycolatopsis sp. PS_44_ISF1 TaxID=2974917 RepID=UPI0028E09112|nr:TetR family transcriptional regulator [Amycolatopsis sp. PS_44_ISF1]MDT8911410.1 TetR family transcriptional regulator [Amycolatopsis sp. PS_44_ISF1]
MPREPLDPDTIVSATEEVLRRHGPEKATVLDVARSLGVSHGSVYRHFPSKAALREAVIRGWLERSRQDFTALLPDSGLPAAERLHSLLTTMFAAKWAKAQEDPELFETFRVLATEHSAVSSAHVTALLTEIRAIVADGITRGEFTGGDAEVRARAVFDATVQFHSPIHAAEWRAPEIKAESEAVIALILDGLRAR